MSFTYDVVGPATAISINSQAGLGFSFYASLRQTNGVVGPVDPVTYPNLWLYIFTISGVNAMVIPAETTLITSASINLYQGLNQGCPSPGAYWIHDHDPDWRDIMTWYRTTIKGLPNVAPYNDWAHNPVGPPGKYPYPMGWNEYCSS